MTALAEAQRERLRAELAGLRVDFEAALVRWAALQPSLALRKVGAARRLLRGEWGRARRAGGDG